MHPNQNLKVIKMLFIRCKVPECDVGENNRDIVYDQTWVGSAIPKMPNGKFKNCVRYAPIGNVTEAFSNKCSADMFNTSAEIACSEFIYASDERNLQTEVRRIVSDDRR